MVPFRAKPSIMQKDPFVEDAVSHLDALHAVACRLTRNPTEAEDLVQTTFLVAIERSVTYDATRPLVPWLMGILINQSRIARRRRKELVDGGEHETSSESTQHSDMESKIKAHDAQEYLLARKLWDTLAGRVVMGQDIGQAYQFVSTGNAELGFVALSQLQSPDKKASGSFYIVPQKYYQPLVQQAIQIKAGAAAAQFLDFLKSAAAKQVIRTYGYEVR